MIRHSLRIGTRGSQLALWQARWVQTELARRWPDIRIDLVIIKTQGDRIVDVPLALVGGKGLFVKEIEEALLDGRIDLAVHSMKDMPAVLPDGLAIGAVPVRENALDALITKADIGFADLPIGARIGTSSLRRSAQLLNRRPDLTIVALRGNLDTRLKKLTSTDLDAIVLAAAGLQRLGLAQRITAYLEPSVMLPAVGQGALCIEHRDQDPITTALISALDHAPSRTAVTAERAFLHRLEGGCQTPIAAYCELDDRLNGHLNNQRLHLSGLVAEVNGSRILKATIAGPAGQAAALGQRLAEELLAQGAYTLLKRVLSDV